MATLYSSNKLSLHIVTYIISPVEILELGYRGPSKNEVPDPGDQGPTLLRNYYEVCSLTI